MWFKLRFDSLDFFSNLHRNCAFLANFEVQFEIINYCFVTEFWYMYVYLIHSEMSDTWRAISFSKVGRDTCSLLNSTDPRWHVINSDMSDTGRVTCAPPPLLKLWERHVHPILAFNQFKDWSTLFPFALGNERTLITCKSCEAWSASQRFTRDQCPFISQCKQKSVLQSLYLC